MVKNCCKHRIRNNPKAKWVSYLSRSECIDENGCKLKTNLNKNNTLDVHSGNRSRYIRNANITKIVGKTFTKTRPNNRFLKFFELEDNVIFYKSNNLAHNKTIGSNLKFDIGVSQESIPTNIWEEIKVIFTFKIEDRSLPNNISIIPPLENGFTSDLSENTYIIKGTPQNSFYKNYELYFQNNFCLKKIPFTICSEPIELENLKYKIRNDYNTNNISSYNESYTITFDNINQLNKDYTIIFDLSGGDDIELKNKHFTLSNNTEEGSRDSSNIKVNIGFEEQEDELSNSGLLKSKKGKSSIKVDFKIIDTVNYESSLLEVDVFTKSIEIEVDYEVLNSNGEYEYKNVDTITLNIKLKMDKCSIYWDQISPLTIESSIKNDVVANSLFNRLIEFSKSNFVHTYNFAIPSENDISKQIYNKIQYEPNIKMLYNFQDISFNFSPPVNTYVENVTFDNINRLLKSNSSLENKKFLIDKNDTMNNLIKYSYSNGLAIDISGDITLNNKLNNNFNLHIIGILENSTLKITNKIPINIIDLKSETSKLDLSNNTIQLIENYFDLLSFHKINLQVDNTENNTEIVKTQLIYIKCKRTPGTVSISQNTSKDNNNMFFNTISLNNSTKCC